MSKVLILEDEPAALQRLEKMIHEIRPQYQIIETSDNIEDAIYALKNLEFDLVLSDIELSDGTCFEVFEEIEPKKPIIFITAYNDYAIKAFNFNGIHYLLKPINYQDLTQAFVKFEKSKINVPNLKTLDFDNLNQAEYQKRFISKIGNKLKIVKTTDIAFFYTDLGMVYAVTFFNNSYVLDETLEHIIKKISPNIFFRINRQMIVNVNSVEDMVAYSSSRLKLKLKVASNQKIVVSKDKTSDFKKWIATH